MPDEHAAVAPSVCALAVHHIIMPIPKIESIVVPHEEALAVEHIVSPFTDVPISIGPAILTLALLGRVLVEAYVLAAVVPLLLAKAVLLVLVPVADVFAAVSMPINSKSLGHVVDELAFVEVARGVIKFSAAIIQIIFPKPLVNGAIRPFHDPVTLLDVLAVFQHLASVNSTIIRLIIYSHVHHVVQLATLVLLQLRQDDLVALLETLPRIMPSKMRLDLDNFLLIARSVSQE